MQKRIFVISSAVAVFVIVFLIAFSAVCSISQFDVVYTISSEYDDYDADGNREEISKSERLQNFLEEKYLHKNYLFFEEENIYEAVAEIGGGYLEVTGIEKTFPNKISVSVKEKYEAYTFVVFDESGEIDSETGEPKATYYVVGDDGTVLNIDTKNRNNVNNKIRNIEIVGIGFNVPQVGEKFAVTEQYRSAYAALQTFIAEINDRDMRGNILRITYWQQEGYDPADWQSIAYFIVETTEGVQMQIFDPVRNAAEKADLVLDIYENPYVMSADEGGEKVYLGDEGRMYGCILAYDYYDRFEGNFTDIIVSYDPEGAPTIVDTAEG